MKIIRGIIQILADFLEFGLCRNQWLWFHIFAGGIGAKFFVWLIEKLIAKKLFIEVPGNEILVASMILVFICAVGWELVESYIETPNQLAKKSVYGSLKIYWNDTVADVVCAMFCAYLVLY